MTQASRRLAPVQAIDDIALAALLSSRICHDLSNPIGALNNSVEFINGGVDAELRAQAFGLIGESARQTAARLQFFRAAFGVGGDFGDSVRQDELRKLVDGYLMGGRVTLEWEAGEEPLERAMTRLLLNLALIGAESLIRGGALRIGVMRESSQGGDDGRQNLIVISEGRGAALRPRVAAILSAGELTPEQQADEGIRPHEAPVLLAFRLAQVLRVELNFGQEENRVVLAARV